MRPESRSKLPASTLALIWAVLLLELISPLPAFLTLGAIWVMLARPPGFLRLVLRLYGSDGPGEGGAGA